MLAEPRQRQKYSINPRGLDWSNDDTKLGQKLLEKMGWRKGKALGLREDGCKEHIKVSTRSDRKGIGCTAEHADNWIAHQEDFNSILSALNKDISTESSVAAFSLHEKSKNSRSRVHYQKFTKGKDLSGYHSTDLSCIFGERQKNAAQTEKPRTDVTESESSSLNGEGDNSFGVLTVTSSTSIDSYFATKLAKLQSQAAKNKSASETVSSYTDDHQEQTEQQLMPSASSETNPVVDCDMVRVKQCKKKRKTVKDGGDCCNIDECVQSKKKKNRRHVVDLSEVTATFNSDSLNMKSCRKKGMPNTIDATELNQPEHTRLQSKEWKKSRHVDSGCLMR